jgi:hypothetical protein
MSMNARISPRAKPASLFGVVSAYAVATASAQEASGRSREVVEKYCGNICHSLDYITMNSPMLDEKVGGAK